MCLRIAGGLCHANSAFPAAIGPWVPRVACCWSDTHEVHRSSIVPAGRSNVVTGWTRQLLGRQHDPFQLSVRRGLAPAHACSALRADTRRTPPSAFFVSTAATKCSLTNLLGAQTFTHCGCPLVETFDFFIGRKNIVSVVRKHSLTLDRVSAGSELLNGLRNRLPVP